MQNKNRKQARPAGLAVIERHILLPDAVAEPGR